MCAEAAELPINLVLLVLCLCLASDGIRINRSEGKTAISWPAFMWLAGAIYFSVAAFGVTTS